MKCICIYCGHETHYGDKGGPTREEAHQLMVKHDQKCPANPVAQELERLRKDVKQIRNAIGDSVTGPAGLTAVAMLEQALRGEA